MKLSDFDYKLPKELIAQYPLKDRCASRMLVLNKSNGIIEHRHFYDLPKYLDKGDAVVLNDTKVFKARLVGKRKGFPGKIELLILKETEKGIFECLAKPSKRFKSGTGLEFGDGLEAEVVAVKDETRLVKFNTQGNMYAIFEKIGQMPLPPYIKRPTGTEDDLTYQTVYAKKPGAVAAPTAGLHFTDSLLNKLKESDVNINYITLHVGYGTFRPIDCENIKEHKMHSEYYEISDDAARAINNAKASGAKILSVGTTACRALESAAQSTIDHRLSAIKDETDIFIYSGYNFKITDMLLTNFHLPKTTLFMLVCAFAGYDNAMRAYREAVEQKYRFYSYGDCMLCLS
ncbi:MAG: tRNA preQ1(34) S-adenosylmethionine ribosyltransferase-isomerase QueA [Candidatus Omnitrophica bacterium]|nr:tRNA preQ1(34) S-adenosylmethionine ribosyltransferase-isomerase QueA [Candidatus Omnitrophota bacterium]